VTSDEQELTISVGGCQLNCQLTSQPIHFRRQKIVLPETQMLVVDFKKVAALAGIDISATALVVESAPAPHVPPSSLPKGKMAVYAFFCRGECLKVGKVGPKSQARYTSQHYIPHSSNSNLAKSLLAARTEMELLDLQDSEIGAWIQSNVDRFNFLLDARCGIAALTLLEVFLQCRLKPRFEGFASQQ